MISRIVIENFMAHEKTEIELHHGVTVLTGANNVGKSAVVEAIRCVAENPPSASMIRHGAKKAIVRLEFDDGWFVQWERTKTSAVYKTGLTRDLEYPEKNEIFAKFGRIVPEDVRKILRIQPIETESGIVDVHIGNQREPIFLLDKTGTQAAAFFAASTEAEYLLMMQKELKERTVAAKREKSRLEQSIRKAEKDLLRIEPVWKLQKRLASAKSLYNKISEIQKKLPQARELTGGLKNLENRIKAETKGMRILDSLAAPPAAFNTPALETCINEIKNCLRLCAGSTKWLDCIDRLLPAPQPRDTTRLSALAGAIAKGEKAMFAQGLKKDILSRLSAPPDAKPVTGLALLAGDIRYALKELRAAKNTREKLDKLEDPPKPRRVFELFEIIRDLKKLCAARQRAMESEKCLSSVTSPPLPQDTRKLESLVESIKKMQAATRRLDSAVKLLLSVEPVVEPRPTDKAEALLSELAAALARKKEVEKQLGDIEAAIRDIETRIENIIKEAGICPVCRRPMTTADFLGKSHGH